MTEDRLYSRIREKIKDDFTPVTPMREAWQRALWILPLCMAYIAATLVFFHFRSDSANFHFLELWGPILLQILVCYLLLTAILKTVVPASFINPLYFGMVASIGALVFLAATLLNYNTSPNYPAPDREFAIGMACFSIIGMYGLFALLAGFFLAKSGLPFRAGIVGLLLGLGSGWTAEASWRLHCPYTSWDHILIYHGGPILLLTATGLVLGHIWKRKVNSLKK